MLIGAEQHIGWAAAHSCQAEPGYIFLCQSHTFTLNSQHTTLSALQVGQQQLMLELADTIQNTETRTHNYKSGHR